VRRGIFEPTRDEVTESWRRLHNEKLHNLYASTNIIRVIKSKRMRWARRVARMGETRNAYKIAVGKPAGKRSIRRYRRRWEHNIIMDLRKIGWKVVEWIHLAQDNDQWRVFVNTAINP
jgi:hypothetical protein